MFFFDGHALLPEFHELGPGDPAQALLDLLEQGPRGDLRNFVEKGSFVDSSEREGLEQISLELSADFWSRPAGEVYAAAAQILFTVATLEEGKEILLLNGTVPGQVLDGSSEAIEQPLTRDDFTDVRPWVEVAQPVAGSTIGNSFPVTLILREGDATVTLVSSDGTFGSLEMKGGTKLFASKASTRGPAELEVVMTDAEGATHTVTVPVRQIPDP